MLKPNNQTCIYLVSKATNQCALLILHNKPNYARRSTLSLRNQIIRLNYKILFFSVTFLADVKIGSQFGCCFFLFVGKYLRTF